MVKELSFGGKDWLVEKSTYASNENLALALVDKEEGYVANMITVNTGEELPKHIAYVKDYSENEGMIEALEKEGMIENMLGYKPSGLENLVKVEFNLEGVEDFKGLG